MVSLLVFVRITEDLKSCVSLNFGILSFPSEVIAEVVHHELVSGVDEEEDSGPVHHVGVGLSVLAHGP